MGVVLILKYKKIDRLRLATLNKLEELKLTKDAPIEVFEEFSKIVEGFLSRRFRLKSAFTYKDVEQKINNRSDLNQFKKRLVAFMKEMSEIKYGSKGIEEKNISELIRISELMKEFKDIVEILSEKDKVYFKKEPLFDFVIEKYLDCCDYITRVIKRRPSKNKP